MLRSATAALLGLLALGAAPASRIPSIVDSSIQQISSAELRRDVTMLASDRMSGRGVGHPGNTQAEQYIAGALRNSKVAPASPGYLQQVEVYQPRLGPDARLTISEGDKPLADLRVGSDFYPVPESGDKTASGRLVFAGHGLSAPNEWNDYAAIDARGGIVLVLDDVPDAVKKLTALSSEERMDLASIDRKVADARAHGAAGVIVVRTYMSDPRLIWPETTSVRSASYRLLGAMRAAPLPVAVISEHAAAPIRRALDAHTALNASIVPGVLAAPVVMNNVLGIVEGREPSGEMVVVGAHLDHDGVDEAGQIYNGADDNASGTAAVLAIGAAFARAAGAGWRPARAVVFALWNGEEKGSLGAEYYAAAPLPARRRVVANLNLDMIGREEEIPDPADPRYQGFARTAAGQNTNVVHLLGYTYSPDLAAIVERANLPIRLTIKEDYDSGSQGLLHRSDNWPFLEHGIPAVFFTTGLHPDYHTPDDDTERIDFAKLERIAELACRAAWMTADGEAPRLKSK
jgi:peptidase M28-like protein